MNVELFEKIRLHVGCLLLRGIECALQCGSSPVLGEARYSEDGLDKATLREPLQEMVVPATGAGGKRSGRRYGQRTCVK